jgi:hypothetical protein
MDKICKENKCGKKVKSSGYCSKHAEQVRRFGHVISTKFDKKYAKIINENIAHIPLGEGGLQGYAIIDLEDIWLEKHNWYKSNNGYATAWINGKDVMLHTLLVKRRKGFDTDHINRDRLDNRRCNLRVVNRKHNTWNREKTRQNSTGYKGIQFDKERNQFRAHLNTNGKLWRSKRYKNIMDAVNAYNIKIKEIRGKFAVLSVAK